MSRARSTNVCTTGANVKRVATLLCLAIAFACVATTTTGRSLTTIQVTNDAGGPIGVYIAGQRVGTAVGYVSCLRLHHVPKGRTTVGFKVLAEGLHYAPMEDLSLYDGWSVRIGRNPETDLLSLQPAPRCSK